VVGWWGGEVVVCGGMWWLGEGVSDGER
jgi:hypothetical protein